MSGGHGVDTSSNKSVALLISVLALFLAFGETLAKSAQTEALSYNVEASNLWAFFQAKTVRQTVLRTAIEQAQGAQPAAGQATPSDAMQKSLDNWTKTVARWESEPETNEGRKQLAARAGEAEHHRDLSLARYHHYELGSAAFQIGIVLASAMVITGIAALAWAGAALGVAGLAMLAIGLFAPMSVHLI